MVFILRSDNFFTSVFFTFQFYRIHYSGEISFWRNDVFANVGRSNACIQWA